MGANLSAARVRGVRIGSRQMHFSKLSRAELLGIAAAALLVVALLLLNWYDLAQTPNRRAGSDFICGRDQEPIRTSRELTDLEMEQLAIACRRAAQDNDLAVKVPAQRVVAALGGQYAT